MYYNKIRINNQRINLVPSPKRKVFSTLIGSDVIDALYEMILFLIFILPIILQSDIIIESCKLQLDNIELSPILVCGPITAPSMMQFLPIIIGPFNAE